MDELGDTLGSLRELLDKRRKASETPVNLQKTLLDPRGFADLVRLARIDHPAHTGREGDANLASDPEETLKGWAEGRRLLEALQEQLHEGIRYLLEVRQELATAVPLHRLPAYAEICAGGVLAPRPAADGDLQRGEIRRHEIFPFMDADGWLVIRRFPDPYKRKVEEGSPEAEAAAPPRLADESRSTPLAIFEDALAAGREVGAALEEYRSALEAANGFLPVPVRSAEEQRRLRRLERLQIERAFEDAGRAEDVEVAGLGRLTELLAERETMSGNWDDHWPLASVWDIVLAVAANAPRTEDTRGRCHPELSREDVDGLKIGADEKRCLEIRELLRRLPPNAFLSFIPLQEVLERRRGDGLLCDWLCGVKDVFALGRTTAASAILESFESQFEATVVRRLREAGCLFPGKTNLDEFALGSSNETSAFKPTPGCPANRLRVAGGSSGGSAAAVAAGLVRIALGSDTAGSIRIPASYCGVVGWKPSYGIVSRYGLLPLSMGLDVVGLLTRNVADCIEAARVIVGEDPRDETTRGVAALDFPRRLEEEERQQAAARPTLGVPVEYFLNVNLLMQDLYAHLVGTRDFDALCWLASDEAKKAGAPPGLDKWTVIPGYPQHFAELLSRLEEEGWDWRLVSLPHTWLSIPAYFALSRSELASSLHRYDGITFGARSQVTYRDVQRTTRAEHLGFQPKVRILMGIHALQQKKVREDECNKVDFDFLELAKQARRLICDDFDRVCDEVDLLLTPTANVVAPGYGGITDTVAQQKLDELTVPANLAGTAAITLPYGKLQDEDAKRDSGLALPTSVQLIAPRFEDARLLVAAQRLEGLFRTWRKARRTEEER